MRDSLPTRNLCAGDGYTVTLDALSYVYGALCDTGPEPAVADVSTALWAYAAAFAEA